MALTTVTVHIEIREPVTNVPAVGTVVFNTMIELRDIVSDIVYAPMTFTATLVAGEATIVLPATDNTDLVPANWVYQVWINTDIFNTTQYFQLPFSVGTIEFADLQPLDFDPCTDQVPLTPPVPPPVSDIYVLRAGDTMTGNLTINANLAVSGDSSIGDDLTVGDNLAVGGDATVTGTVTAASVTASDLTATDDLVVGDSATVGGDMAVTGTGTFGISVDAPLVTAITVTATGTVTGDDLSAVDDLFVGDNATIGGSIGVTGLGTFGVSVNTPLVTATTGNITTVNSTTVTATGTVTGDDLVATDDLTVGDDATVGGDLAVTGTLTTGALSILGDLLVGDDLTVTDDTQMTGDLNVDGTSTVHYTSTTLNVAQLLTMGLSTSVISGGEITVNGGDPSKIDISAMTGYIVTYNSSAALSGVNPLITFVSTPAQIAVAPGFPVTRYFFNSAGAIIQTGTPITATQRRQNIYIGATVTLGGVVTIDQTLPVIPSQLNNQLVDLMQDMGGFSISGNLVSPNGVNLMINKTTGQVFTRAFNQIPNFLQPHSSTLAVQTPVNFRHITAVPGGAGAVVTVLNVGSYDPGGLGVVTPVGGGANTSTNFRVWGAANNTVNEQVFIQYGQNVYSSLANATAAIGSGVFVPNPAAMEGTALLGWISVIRTATNLSDPLQAIFTKASKFATP